VFGYQIEKLRDKVTAPIDVLDLLLTQVSADRPDFFFAQIGANDGLTDDPIRQFVTKYHWRGVLVEPQPQVFQHLLKNYEQEKQLILENAAIADNDGTARLCVADHRDETANLTVFASLKKDALIRGLDNPKAAGVSSPLLVETEPVVKRCFRVFSGPGVSNLATGLATATSEGDPVVAVTAGIDR
jgi:FkbM family methyltransferase